MLDVRRAVAFVVHAAGKVPGAAGATIRIAGGCAVTPASTRPYKMNERFALKPAAGLDLGLREPARLRKIIRMRNSLIHSTMCLTLH